MPAEVLPTQAPEAPPTPADASTPVAAVPAVAADIATLTRIDAQTLSGLLEQVKGWLGQG